MNKLPEAFTMPFEPSTIEHLGLKLYSTLPPVIGELVSNAWDADSEKVEISLPVGEITVESEITVKDYGHGMDSETLQNGYLPIGRDRRKEESTDESPGGRPLMGRKGLGKLSAFGVASELEVRTVKEGFAICIRIDYERIRTWPVGETYKPEIIYDKCGETAEYDGTEIHIKNLKRKTPITDGYIDTLRRTLARRFPVIGTGFRVYVNGVEITKEDRRSQEECRAVWDVRNLPGSNIIDKNEGWVVEGWIGLIAKSSQTERGVDVFARGKAVELETMFGLKTTHIQFARAYVVGEVHADFLDAEEDYVSTARNSVLWESEAGRKLAEWGAGALKYVFKQWNDIQQKEKEAKLMKTEDFEIWLQTKNTRERKVAIRLLNIIVKDPHIEPESAKPLLEIIKTNVEHQAFRELVDEMENSETKVEVLLRLFEEWRILEAREHLKLSDGRLISMEQLARYIEEGALEVKQIQPLFENNGWLVEPTWGAVTGQTSYTEMLRKYCKEPEGLAEEDRRIDILGYEVGGTIHVVELKRPEKTLSRKDLNQIEEYVDWARANLVTTGSETPSYIRGRLIVGKLNPSTVVQKKVERLASSDIRVETFSDLLHRSRKIYGEVEGLLKTIAPEYSREARLKIKKAAAGIVAEERKAIVEKGKPVRRRAVVKKRKK
jgi:hypothetical protein